MPATVDIVPGLQVTGGQLEPASWDEALDVIAERLNGIKASAGAAAIGGIGSEVTSNEDSFVFQAFLRQAVGTNNVDHRMGTERRGYSAMRPGPGAIAALPKSDVVLLFGSDLTAEVPVMDGSSDPFVFLIEMAGTARQDAPRKVIEILAPVEVASEGPASLESPQR